MFVRAPLLAVVVVLVGLACPVDSRAVAPPAGPRLDRYGDPLPRGAIARLGTVRWRARMGVRSMAFVPGGKYLATADGSSLSVWDLRTGRVVRTISDDATPLGNGFSGAFAFTPDGKRLVSADAIMGKVGFLPLGGRKPTLLLWDFASGKLLEQSPALGGEPTCVAVRRDGRLVACGTHLGGVLLWEPGKKAVRRLDVGVIDQVAFSADGKRLITLREERGQHVDLISGKVARTLKLGECKQYLLASDGTVATYYSPDRVCLYDAESGKEHRLPLKEKVGWLDLSFSADSRTLLALEYPTRTLQFWDVAGRRQVRRLHVLGLDQIPEWKPLVLSQDGKVLASSDRDRAVRLWDAATGQPLLHLPGHVQGPLRLTFSHSGKEVISFAWLGENPGGELFRWNATTGQALARVIPKAPYAAYPAWSSRWLISPGGRRLVETAPEGVHLYDTRTGKRQTLIVRKFGARPWAFHPDGQTLAMAGPDRKLWLCDTTTGKLWRGQTLGDGTNSVSWINFTPDGRLATGECWQMLRLWDANGKRETTLALPAKRGPIVQPDSSWETAFSSEGRYLFLSSFMKLWVGDLQRRREIEPFEEDKYEWSTSQSGPVAVSPDGRLLAWIDPGWTLCLYEIATGKIIHRFERGRHSAIAFAPAGWRLATGCDDDGSVLVWDIRSLFVSRSPPGFAPKPDILWADLSATDASRAHRAIWRLADFPEADTLLARRLNAVEPMPSTRLRRLLADLASSDFATRRKAEQALAEAREGAHAALGEAHRKAGDVELRLRLERLLARLKPRSPQRLREARAVMALEIRATPEARRLLRRLAAGLPGARLTEEARAALRRLDRTLPSSAGEGAPT